MEKGELEEEVEVEEETVEEVEKVKVGELFDGVTCRTGC